MVEIGRVALGVAVGSYRFRRSAGAVLQDSWGAEGGSHVVHDGIRGEMQKITVGVCCGGRLIGTCAVLKSLKLLMSPRNDSFKTHSSLFHEAKQN